MREGIDQAYAQPAPKRGDVYANNEGKAVGDFLLGFFGVWIIGVILWFLFMGIASVFGTLGHSYLPFMAGIQIGSMIILGLLYIALPIYFLKIRRKYIAIGIWSSLILPALIFGACLMIVIISFGGGF